MGEPIDTQRTPPSWELYTQRDRRAFLLVLFLVGTCNYVDRNVLSLLLEPIKAEFRVSDTMLGLLSGLSFALLYATLGLPVARWADRGDRKHIITLSLGVWSVMTALCGMAGTFWHLAAARIGVGAGEAGAIPPAQSLLADYYAPAQRSWAIGIFTMSSAAGYAIGLVVGGLIAQRYGWRVAFVAAGSWGLLLAPVAHRVLKEPRQHASFAVRTVGDEPALAAIRALLSKSAYRNILAAIVIYFFMAYGALVFIISLMIRVHRLSVAQAGIEFGVVSAIGAVVGSVAGGTLAGRLASRDLTWLARLAGWGLIAAAPCFQLALASSSLPMMVPVLLLSMVVLAAVVPSMFSALHVVCGSRRRALAVAVAFFFANLIGLGLGPLATGALSDFLAVRYGAADGLRGALMLAVMVLLPAGWLMLRAARHLGADAES